MGADLAASDSVLDDHCVGDEVGLRMDGWMVTKFVWWFSGVASETATVALPGEYLPDYLPDWGEEGSPAI